MQMKQCCHHAVVQALLAASKTLISDFASLLESQCLCEWMHIAVLSDDVTVADRHLRAFHMAVPALVAAAVEAALVAKEALARRRRGPAAAGFTDDGFPLGLVFLLKAQPTPPPNHPFSTPHTSSCGPHKMQ